MTSQKYTWCRCLLSICAVLTAAPAALAVQQEPGKPVESHRPHAGMLRFPDVSKTHIVFGYANDLWAVPREGGTATPLASPPGQELFPRFSRDGEQIGFVGNYEGNKDLYVMPIEGGVPTRLTYHPSQEILCDWTPDGKLLYYSNAFAGLPRQTQLLTVAPEGGLPEKLPVPYGTNGSISDDGQWLAYTPHSHDGRTWKRYRGGMATDIWLFNLKDHSAKKITDWEGTDSQPMWFGKKLYYFSDRGSEHRLNIWSYDPAANKHEQITKLADFDVKWPSMGPGLDGKGEIVFQYGRDLQLLSLADNKMKVVEVIIPGDRPTIRPYDYDAKDFVGNWNISSSGKRAVIEARGEVWTLPAKHGAPLNLTRTPGVAERDPAWSPDGQWIAYFGDETGEYELYITQSDGRGETRKLTSNGHIFRNGPTWSPDSKRIAFSDKDGGMYLHTLEPADTKMFDKEPWGNAGRMSWAPDSRWISYIKGMDNQGLNAIWMYNVESGEKHQVTSGMFSDSQPTFDRKGDYFFFASNRNFNTPTYEDIGTTFVYNNTDMLFVVPLRDKVGSPFAPKSDEEKWGKDKEEEEKKDGDKKDEDKKDNGDKEDKEEDGDKADDKKNADSAAKDKADEKKDEGKESDEETKDEEKDGKDADKKKEEIKPIDIEIPGFERRAIKIPVDSGAFFNLAVNDEGKLLYNRRAGNGPDAKTPIKIFDLKDEKKKENTVLEEADGFLMSADGKKILVRKAETMAILDPKADQKMEDALNLAAMKGRTNPREEWEQMFMEAWRIQRDYFYDPNMHGVDWEDIYSRYLAMTKDCASREDLDYVIGEMISELNVGHAYVRGGGDREKEPTVQVGMLGCDFALDNGAYKIAKIHEGGPWDYDARGPLSQPGLEVKEGDYLLAVNGAPVDPQKDPWAAFQNLGGKAATITVSSKPTLDADARHVVIEFAADESNLRYRAWIEKNRQYVETKSEGKIGYIYVPNTGVNGQNDLFRQFYGQKDKAALVIDERWNGGGQIPTRFIELLNRPITNYWATRADKDWSWPPDAHAGPKCMLINGLAGSGGDCFPYYFKQAKIGKTIGMRTWGGLVGISGNPLLMDTGWTSAPTFAFYETDGTWGVEGHGVDPDIEVIDDPSKMVDGGDPQLDAAIEHLLGEIQKNGYTRPKRPAYPNRKGMGIRDEDK